jgi:hypothetical protein
MRTEIKTNLKQNTKAFFIQFKIVKYKIIPISTIAAETVRIIKFVLSFFSSTSLCLRSLYFFFPNFFSYSNNSRLFLSSSSSNIRFFSSSFSSSAIRFLASQFSSHEIFVKFSARTLSQVNSCFRVLHSQKSLSFFLQSSAPGQTPSWHVSAH